jgi:hypothetical protein
MNTATRAFFSFFFHFVWFGILNTSSEERTVQKNEPEFGRPNEQKKGCRQITELPGHPRGSAGSNYGSFLTSEGN